MNNYGNFYGNGNQYGYGYQYDNRPLKEPQFSNPLSDEQRKLLQRNENFSLAVTKEQQARSYCTHRDPNTKRYSLTQLPDGGFKCNICGTVIYPEKVTGKDYVEQVTAEFANLMEVVKMLGVDLSNKVIQQYFITIPFIEKLPALYSVAREQFEQYESGMSTRFADTNGDFNPYSPYNSLMGGFFNNASFGNPYNMQPSTPYMQPPIINGYGQGYQNGNNPFYNNNQQVPDPNLYQNTPNAGMSPTQIQAANMVNAAPGQAPQPPQATDNNTAPAPNPVGNVTSQVTYDI